jgi:hypothetical protein
LALETALSAKAPHHSDQQAMDAVRAAAQLRPGPRTPAEELKGLAEAILTLQKFEPGVTADQGVAWTQQALRVARVNELEKFSQHLMPALVQGRDFFPNTKGLSGIASLGIAMGQMSDDPHGRFGGNAYRGLLKQLRVLTGEPMQALGMDPENFAQVEQFLFQTPAGLALRKRMLGPLWGKGGVTEADLQSMSPDMEAAVEALVGAEGKVNLKGEAKGFVSMMQYLKGEQKFGDVRRQVLADLPEPQDPRNVQRARAREAELNAAQLQQAAIVDRKLAAVSDAIRLGNKGGVTGALRTRLPELLQDAGVGKTIADLAMAKFDAKSAFAKTDAERLQVGIDVLEAAKPRDRGLEFAEMGVPGFMTPEFTAEEKRAAGIIEEGIKQLQRQKLEAGTARIRVPKPAAELPPPPGPWEQPLQAVPKAALDRQEWNKRIQARHERAEAAARAVRAREARDMEREAALLDDPDAVQWELSQLRSRWSKARQAGNKPAGLALLKQIGALTDSLEKDREERNRREREREKGQDLTIKAGGEAFKAQSKAKQLGK